MLDLLRQWWKTRRRGFDSTTPVAERWLFSGQRPGKPMTTRQLSRLFHEAADAAGIKKSVTLHGFCPLVRSGTRWRRPCSSASVPWSVRHQPGCTWALLPPVSSGHWEREIWPDVKMMAKAEGACISPSSLSIKIYFRHLRQVLGGILLAATILGIVTFDPMAMVAGLALLLGGGVIFGSNTSTANQLSESMRNAEAMRAGLIGRLDLRLVEDRTQNWQV
jgi:hypothetical protein